MKISRNWLSDYVDLSGLSDAELGERFTMSTAEIEGVEKLGDKWPGVVTAKIVSIEPHPDAEKLRLPTVDIGGETMRLVCGAPNIEVGQIVPLARIGCELPGGLKLKKAKIRGVESEGMLCSQKELGMSEESSGIMLLPPDTPLGIPLSQALGMEDTIYVVDNKSITHRPDLWGHYGIAREVAAVFERKLNPMTATMPEGQETVTIENEAPEFCPRYSATLFTGIQVGPSPEWLTKRLEAVGSRSINNVVDATNYVLYELGQPLHAFDRKKLSSSKIGVRLAHEGEVFQTLDGVERKLLTSDLVIADQAKAVALAGVMGGENTEVDETTTEVLLESANFHPATIRRTANRLALRTDAANRYEKSLDPAMTEIAVRRFYELLRETCPGLTVVAQGDCWPNPPSITRIGISSEFINRRLGTNLPVDRMKHIFECLGFGVEGNDPWTVVVPTWRATKDVGIPEDLVEEIGRVFGYDNIQPEAPTVAVAPPRQEPLDLLARQLREIASVSCGFTEVYCYSFNGEEEVKKLGLAPEKHLQLANPLNQEQTLLRRSLLPNLLLAARENFKRFDRFALYEIGKVYLTDDPKELPQEPLHLCAVVGGRKSPNGELFFEGKGLAERILAEVGIENLVIEPGKEVEGWMHPGRTAFLKQGETVLGTITELHPKVAQAFDLGGALGVVMLDADRLQAAKKKERTFEGVPVFPPVTFDVSVLVDRQVLVADVEKALKNSERKLLKQVTLFDIYEGKNLPEGKKSLAFSLLFSSPERTLEPKEIEKLQTRVTGALERQGYSVRSAK